MNWLHVLQQWVYLYLIINLSKCEQLVYTFSNHVGAGNYSYFKLHRDGVVRLVLITTSGDADLYISSTTLSPDYTNYELSAVTCGEDEITVPAEMSRPVGVGVYGHPSHDLSDFTLEVYITEVEQSGSDPSTLNTPHAAKPPALDTEQEDSLLWSIFVSIMKIILDILV